MKAKLLYIATAFLVANLTTAQLLYTEDFESYNTGPFSNDLTGTTPTHSGWYTNAAGSAITVNDYKIVADPVKGKILQILDENSTSYRGTCTVYRTDLNTFWQQRAPGNNVLKLSFDIHTGPDTNGMLTEILRVGLFNEKELLTNFEYRNGDKLEGGHVYLAHRGITIPVSGSNGLRIKYFPADSWVTVQLYIDYDNDQVYFSVPSLNYTLVGDTLFPLSLTGGDHDDNPVKLEIINGTMATRPPQGRKIDNINLSAQNTVPTVSVEAFISEKFNVFPNPANDMVMITNSENIGIEEIALYNMDGKIVKSQNGENENEITLNMQNLATGMYLLHIHTKEGTAVKKITKK